MSLNGSQTLKKALDILFVLGEAETPLSVSEIAQRASIPESTVYRLLQTLENNGIIERKSKGQITLGLRILELARSLTQQMDRYLNVIARPIMEKITEKTNETSILAVRSGIEVICIESIASSRLIRFAIENGRLLPLHRGASGKIILAYENEKIVEQVLQKLSSEQEKKQLISELEKIREQGCCITIGEVDSDICGISAPIFNYQGRVVASLTVAGPAERIDLEARENIVSVITDAAHQVSQKFIETATF